MKWEEEEEDLVLRSDKVCRGHLARMVGWLEGGRQTKDLLFSIVCAPPNPFPLSYKSTATWEKEQREVERGVGIHQIPSASSGTKSYNFASSSILFNVSLIMFCIRNPY